MLPEMSNVLWVYQILLTRILVMVLLKVVDFVFVLVITVMARAESEVGKFETPGISD
ncbi:hypothetical protein LTR60_007558, partial [Cryomyces antarcticus]